MPTLENIALFDLDGTLADYDGAMLRDLRKLAAPGETTYSLYHEDLPAHLEARKNAISRQPGWWADLEELTLGFDVLRECVDLGFQIHILTKGPRSKPAAWKEKVEWFQQHVLPLAPEADITITQDKGLVYGKVLIDDFPPYMLRWLEHRPRGLGFMPLSEQNKDFSHPNVVLYDGRNLVEVQERLQEAYARQAGK
ncbi:MAG: hypothetical protein Q8R53_00225 [Nanoarchaeota archaeon]|nr:hypothetical protein [Nanoarchaeota archaeon]